MNLLKNLKREARELKCPSCEIIFIPISFDLEYVYDKEFRPNNLEFSITSEKLQGYSHKIYPFTYVSKYWVTYCPKCGYVMRFIAELWKKQLQEKVEGETPKWSVNEFSKRYKYELIEIKPPCKDRFEYYKEKLEMQIVKITSCLDEAFINEWSTLYKEFSTNTIDGLKFLIRFISTLDQYIQSIFKVDLGENNMPEKIKILRFSDELKDSLIKINTIRNKIVHEGYEITSIDEEFILDTFKLLIYGIIEQKLETLNLKEEKLPENFDLIEKRQLYYFMQGIIQNYIGTLFRFKNMYKEFSIPLLKKLGIYADYNEFKNYE